MFLIITLLYAFIGCSQEINLLNTEEFYDKIEFNNTCLSKIIEIHESTGSLESIFSSGDSKDTNADGGPYETLNYWIKGSLYSFEDSEETGDKKLYNITYLEFGTNTKIKLFDGTILRIGDSSSKLEKYKKFSHNVTIFNQEDTNASLEIKTSNNKISEIKIVFF